ncbi:hypothetical protein [Halorubrum halodurans]|uniref:hypothetical protein n=1 Tax=Halorubrum halodurans TaxID=1383851 RepID=UPI0015C65B38|nr:hypothetical protein [Halorubrum halodurans]
MSNDATIVPGMPYVVAYSLGALLALIDPGMALFGVTLYIVFIVGMAFASDTTEASDD